MKFKTHLLFLCLVLLAFNSQAQSPKINRIDPPFWWNNLQEKELQLCVYGSNVALFDVQVKTASAKLIKTEKQLDSIFFEERYNIDNKKGSLGFDKKIIVFEDIDCIGDIVLDREKKKNNSITGF